MQNYRKKTDRSYHRKTKVSESLNDVVLSNMVEIDGYFIPKDSVSDFNLIKSYKVRRKGTESLLFSLNKEKKKV